LAAAVVLVRPARHLLVAQVVAAKAVQHILRLEQEHQDKEIMAVQVQAALLTVMAVAVVALVRLVKQQAEQDLTMGFMAALVALA
jgi:hypothetical protein